MNPRKSETARRPRGTSMVFFALMMPVIVGGIALAVDVAVLTTAEAQLQTVSDSAALAGAVKVAHDQMNGVQSVVSDAQSQAKTIAQANSVLGQSAVILDNSSNASSGDVAVGYLAQGVSNSTLVTTPSSSSQYYNAVQVTASRSSNHGGNVPTFFAKYLGFGGSNLSVQSTAVAQPYGIKGFQARNGLNSSLLPIVLTLGNYTNMMNGSNGDQYAYNASTNTVSSGSDGISESVLYPVDANFAGNWGTIKVGVSDNSTSTLSSQIQYGITASELATYPSGVIELDPTTGTIQFSANPGLSAGISSALQAIIGKPVTIPVYDPNQTTGKGNNTVYTVVKFVVCRIMAVNFQGNPKYVIVQPAAVLDPTAIPDPTAPTTWTGGGAVQIYLAR